MLAPIPVVNTSSQCNLPILKIKMLLRLRFALKRLELNLLSTISGFPLPPECTLTIGAETSANLHNPKTTDGGIRSKLKDVIGDGFLWAVPKSRRSKEKRLSRKFGWPEYVWKPLVPKTNIFVCNSCGHDYEAGHLCPNCYKRVRLETEEMRKAIETELKLDPIEKEVVVLYENELKDDGNEYWQGKRIVEMKKPRPPWFSKNLLQRSTAETSDAVGVKPTDLA